MAQFVFKLPDVGEGVAEAELVAWHVAPGQIVEEDQPLVDVMTDKATVEITSPVAGRVEAIFGEPGARTPIGSQLAIFEVEDGAAATAPAPGLAPKVAPDPQPAVEAPAPDAASVSVPVQPSRPAGQKPLASPSVRQRARDLGVRLEFVAGSGPAGRIGHADLDAYLAGGQAARPGPSGGVDRVETIKIVGLRRRIADKMAQSKRTIPHFSYIEEVDVTELEALRTHLNGEGKGRPKLTLLPLFVRATVVALRDFPNLNAHFDDEAGVLHRRSAVHAGIAVQTPAGLMVPVLRHAESRSLWDMAQEIVRLAEAARAGSATVSELTGSTITVTSLGPLGGVAHTPVINPPEVAIVGPNKVVERPVVRDGQVVVRKVMNVSSSFDHRIVDGHDAASFIQRLRGLLEHPGALFVD